MATQAQAQTAIPAELLAQMRIRRPRGRRSAVARWARLALAIAIFVVMAFPIYWMLVTAISPPSDLFRAGLHLLPRRVQFSNFLNTWHAFPWSTWFMNSVVIALISVVLTVSIALLGGYAFATLRFRGKSLLFLLIISTLMIPVQVIMVPQFRIVVRLHWFNTFWAVIIPMLASAFGIFLSRQFMTGIPDELLEAARVDGAGHVKIFYRIVLPLCKPLIAVLILFNFQYRWNDFAWPLIVLKDQRLYTVTIGLLYMQGQYATSYTSLMGMALVSILPMALLFIFFQRYFVEGFARSGIK